MTTPTETNRDPLIVIARMRAKPGKRQELRTALEGLIDPHLSAPHLAEFSSKIDDLIDESGPLVIQRVRCIA